VKPLTFEDYTTHMVYVDLSDRMAVSYSVSKKTWKWMKNSIFHLLDVTILNSYILYKFREQLVRDLVVLSHEENTEIRGVPRGRSSS
jgi:hypothetical protein